MKKTKSGKGGKRVGAGRPYGSGRYGETTYSVRIPESLLPKVSKMLNDFSTRNHDCCFTVWNLIGTVS